MTVGDLVGLLLTPQGRVDPYPTYEAIRAFGPVAPMDGDFHVATGYAVIQELLRDPRMLVPDTELYTTWMPDWAPGEAAASILRSMLQTNGADHTRMRRLAAGAFTARRVAGLRDTVQALAIRLADELADAGPGVDFMDHFAYPLPIQVICSLLGVPATDQAWFREQAAPLTVILEPQLLWEELAEADAAAVRLGGYFAELVARRRAEPSDDLTTALVQAHDADGATLSGDELLANLILLLVAGFETTTNLLGNGLVALLEHGGTARRLRDDPRLAVATVEEMLRYDSPVQLTARWTRQATSVAGVEVAAHGQVLMLLGAGNRDPARFADPERFDPDRAGNQPLSFGGGAHYCLGAPLARLEAQVAFPLLLTRFPELALEAPPQRRDRLTLRGYARLPIRPR